MMKNKTLIYTLLLVCLTVAGLWILPALVRRATYAPDNYPFIYYSSVLRDFGIFDYANKELPMGDRSGNRYTPEQSDSLTPFFSYRQLISDGRMPDSIAGYAMTMPLLRSTSVMFRHNPRTYNAPQPSLHILFESMPKRGGLTLPDDVFRLRNDIRFIDAQTNSVDFEKSTRFGQAMDKAGFGFPAQWASGNPNVRKAYDEGYFVLDANGALFHLKMVNNRPYVRNTGAGDELDIRSFSMYEASDKRFYGFIFDRQGGMYILESEPGGYRPVRLGIDPLDPARDNVSIMSNLLYWTVTVTTPEGRKYYALDNPTLTRVDEHFIPRSENAWDKASRLLFPVYLTFEQSDSSYVAPVLHFTGAVGLIANLIAAIVVFIVATGCSKKKAALSLFALLTGLAGLLAMAMLPGLRNKYVKH